MSPVKILLTLGVLFLAAGALLWLANRFGGAKPLVTWIGHLPGDIRIERPGFRFYFPFATCLLLSLVLTLLLRLFRR